MYDENDDDDFELFDTNEQELNDEDPFFDYNDITEFNDVTQANICELNNGSPFFEEKSLSMDQFYLFSSQLKNNDLFNQTNNNNVYDESLFFDC